jgi:hypothetical protein
MVVNGKATSMVFFKEIGADNWLNL